MYYIKGNNIINGVQFKCGCIGHVMINILLLSTLQINFWMLQYHNVSAISCIYILWWHGVVFEVEMAQTVATHLSDRAIS